MAYLASRSGYTGFETGSKGISAGMAGFADITDQASLPGCVGYSDWQSMTAALQTVRVLLGCSIPLLG